MDGKVGSLECLDDNTGRWLVNLGENGFGNILPQKLRRVTVLQSSGGFPEAAQENGDKQKEKGQRDAEDEGRPDPVPSKAEPEQNDGNGKASKREGNGKVTAKAHLKGKAKTEAKPWVYRSIKKQIEADSASEMSPSEKHAAWFRSSVYKEHRPIFFDMFGSPIFLARREALHIVRSWGHERHGPYMHRSW